MISDATIRVLYLFTSYRGALLEAVKRGENHGTGFWGMVELSRSGVLADFAEVEQVYPRSVVRLMRAYISVHFIHLPVFWKLFAYDIVFTSTAFGTQLCMTALRALGIRTPRWVMHDFSITGVLGRERTLKQRVCAWMVSRADGIVTLSTREKELLAARFPHLASRIAYIPFGVNTAFFQPQALPEKRQVLAVGFDPDRDWKTLVAATAKIDVSVVLATRPTRVRHLGLLPARVSVRQFELPALVREYAQSAVVVVPLDTSGGVNDAMGCSTLFEALAMGKAVVATDTHTMRSYITSGENGLLVPEGDVAAMREAISRLLSDEELCARLGQAARAYALAHLDAEKLAGQLAEYFKRLAAQK